jgi:AraC-like DNA-binding protein
LEKLQLYHRDEATVPGAVEPLHFDTEGFDDDTDRRGLCAELLPSIVGDVRIGDVAHTLRGLRGVLCRLPGLKVMTCFFPAVPLGIAGCGEPSSSRILMLRSMEGPLVVVQDGQRVEATSGDFLFVSGERPFQWALPEGGRLDCGSLQADSFGLPMTRLAGLMLRPIPKTFPPLQLLVTYGAYLLMRGPHSSKEAEIANVHFNEILPLVVAYLEEPKAAGEAQRRLSPVKTYIEDNLGNSELDVGAVAGVIEVTPRYVQKLFQQEGTTFSRYLLERRLLTAKKRLTNRHDSRAISTIAYEVGFGDLSYFNRTFRKRFGMPPSQIRNCREDKTSVDRPVS